MGTLTARNVLLITSIVRKYKLHNVQNLYNNLYRLHTSNKTLTTVDTIDEFTTRLVKDKAKKWTAIQKRHSDECTEDLVFVNPWKIDFKSKLKDISECNKLKLDIRDLTVHQINSLISSAIDDEAFHDVEYLILQCMQNGQCPSVETILEVLSVYSFNGNIKMVTSLQRFYRLVQPEIASTNSDFNHYLAKAHWMKGNVEKALGIYVEVYGTSSSLRGTIRKMLKFLINDTIINRSEASVVILRRYAMLFGENFNEWYPMMYFWEGCWLSEWFGDQQLAETLFKDCDPLRKCLHDKLLPITQNALNNHLEDPVLRLLQLLLRVDMKSCYADVIGALFDYRHVRKDFRGCIEIMQNCVPLEITLSVLQQKKFLNLLISNGFKCPPIGQKIKEKSEKDTFPFKF